MTNLYGENTTHLGKEPQSSFSICNTNTPRETLRNRFLERTSIIKSPISQRQSRGKIAASNYSQRNRPLKVSTPFFIRYYAPQIKVTLLLLLHFLSLDPATVFQNFGSHFFPHIYLILMVLKIGK